MENLLKCNLETKTLQNEYYNYSSIKEGYKIPNIIHFTFCNNNLPLEIIQNIYKNKRKCKYCIFKFYDDNDCDFIIKTHFNEQIYNAYSSINPKLGAMKADFFRYCILYLIGGIYVDIKSAIHIPIFKIINKTDTCILDIPRDNLENWRKNCPTYEQWLLIFAPNHPYLYAMIQQMVEYIQTKYEPKIYNRISLNTKEKILHVTGPDAFTKAITNTIIKQQNKLHRNVNYDNIFELHRNINYKKMYSMNNKKHYSEINESLYK